MNHWVLLPEWQQLQAGFGQLDRVFSLQGEHITKKPITDLIQLKQRLVLLTTQQDDFGGASATILHHQRFGLLG